MPSIASHFVVAKLVSKYLHISSDEFYKGNILPDIIDRENSHLKVQGAYYDVPNIKYFYNNLNFQNDLELGYLCHLMLDKYFLEEYLPLNIKNYQEVDPFLSKKMYNDYTKINYLLVKEFDLDVDYINRIMYDINNVDVKKVKSNLDNINNKNCSYELECLELDKYILFLKEVSIKITKTLKEKR